MNILIIGGTGVISTAVTKEALSRGYSITMINRGNNLKVIPKGNVKVIISDKRNYKYLEKELENTVFDAVVDFIIYDKASLIEGFRFYSKFAKQYVFISSCGVYDKRIQGILDENSPKVLDGWNYSKNKWECEVELCKLAKENNINYTIVRPAITYDNTRIPYGIMPPYGYHWTLISRILNHKPIITWKNGEVYYNMMRVEDFAVGFVGLLGNSKAYNEAFNICGDETTTYAQVLNVLSDIIGEKIITIDIPTNFYGNELGAKKGELIGRSYCSNNSNKKIKQLVPDFRQNISLHDGLEMTYRSYLNNNYQRGIDWEYDADTDRIVKKWCKSNKYDATQYNLRFIDYLGNAKFSDKIKYYMTFHKTRFDILVMNKCMSIRKRIIYKMKSLF